MKSKRRLIVLYRSYIEIFTQVKRLLGQGSLPDFIIIGAQKGGTSSLYQYLKKHPQILRANLKELHFFSKEYHKGLNWYKACFPSTTRRNMLSKKINKQIITGEASPYYIMHPNAPKLMASVLPEIKLIAILRNPVDRLISHYNHMVRIGRETLPLKEAIDNEEKRIAGEFEKIQASQSHSVFTHATFSYLARGRYIEQLERFTKYFRKEQILVLKSEEFFANTQSEYDKVLEFLNVEPYILNDAKPKNVGSYNKENQTELRQELQQYFKPYNDRLYSFLGEDFGW